MCTSTKISLKQQQQQQQICVLVKKSHRLLTFALEKRMEPPRGVCPNWGSVHGARSCFLWANWQASNATLLIANVFLKGMARSTKYKENLKICLEKDPLVISFNARTTPRKLFSAEVCSSLLWGLFPR